MKNKYIAHQECIKITHKTSRQDINISSIVRVVTAETKEEAIVLFVLNTKDNMLDHQKLIIECELIENYIQIK